LRVDPKGIKEELNVFLFSFNNPIKYTDIQGLMGQSPPKPKGYIPYYMNNTGKDPNCLGYALTGDPSIGIYPENGYSLKEIVESFGYKCQDKPINKSSECKCCSESVIINLDDGPFDKPYDWKEAGQPFHATRKGKDDGEWTDITPKDPKVDKVGPFEEVGYRLFDKTFGEGRYCCCKSNS
jgi:hypothetical protein